MGEKMSPLGCSTMATLIGHSAKLVRSILVQALRQGGNQNNRVAFNKAILCGVDATINRVSPAFGASHRFVPYWDGGGI